MFDLSEIEEIRGRMDKKIPQIPFLRSRKGQDRLGIQLFCRDERRKGVKVRIDMGRYHLYNWLFYFFVALHLIDFNHNVKTIFSIEIGSIKSVCWIV